MACTNDTSSDFSELIYALVGACSDHGNCLNGICVCDSGWTGVSDFLSLEGTRCHIPVQWHPLVFLPIMLLHVHGIFSIIKQLRPFMSSIRKRIKSQQGSRNRSSKLSWFALFEVNATAARAYDPITVLVPLLLGYIISGICYSLKAFVPNTAWASSSLSSVAFTILSVVKEFPFFLALINIKRINIETSAKAVGINPVEFVRFERRLASAVFVLVALPPRSYAIWMSFTAESRFPSFHPVVTIFIFVFCTQVQLWAAMPTLWATRTHFKTALDNFHPEHSNSMNSHGTQGSATYIRRKMMIERLETALTKLDDTLKAREKMLKFGVIFLLFQSIPQLFPYLEYMNIAFGHLRFQDTEAGRKTFARRKIAPDSEKMARSTLLPPLALQPEEKNRNLFASSAMNSD